MPSAKVAKKTKKLPGKKRTSASARKSAVGSRLTASKSKKTSSRSSSQLLRRPVLSRKVSRILPEKSAAKLVLFDPADSCRASRKVAVQSQKNKEINIKIISHPLDVYLSPHRLDLSQSRFIEKVRPTAVSSVTYGELPGGSWLEKFLIFELIDFKQSEILNSFKSLGSACRRLWPFGRRYSRFTPKLTLKNSQDFTSSVWEEVALVDIGLFFIASLRRVGEFWRDLTASWRDWSKNLSSRDEIIDFSSRQQLTEAPIFVKASSVLAETNIARKEEITATTEWSAPKPPLPEESVVAFSRPSFFASVATVFNWRSWRLSYQAALAFLFLAALFISPFGLATYWKNVQQVKGQVLGEAEQAINNLELAQNALTNFNFASSTDYFVNAETSFATAREQLQGVGSFLIFLAEALPADNALANGKNLIELGDNLSLAGKNLVNGVNALTAADSDVPLTDKIKTFQAASRQALISLQAAQKNLDKVGLRGLPEDNQANFQKLRDKLPELIEILSQADKLMSFAVEFLGDNDLKRYLVVFQNDNELRATGGFMGSFALVDLKSGKIDNLNMPGGGTYDLRAGFKELLSTPEALKLVAQRWEFQDANWWPDWPTSAQNIAWFYGKSGGPSVDGVIAINSDWLSHLLAVLGPIELPDYQKTITAANFEEEIQNSVEREYEDKSQPKKILGDLAPQLIDKIFDINPAKVLDLAAALNQGLKEKDILIYLDNPELKEFVAKNNWDGAVVEAPKDYLQVVATNIGGGKTDNVIKQRIFHQARVQADGSVIDTVIISRYNFGPVDDYFTVVPNRSYLRIYVPAGSQLIAASGFVQPAAKDFKPDLDYLSLMESVAEEEQAVSDKDSLTKIYNESGKTVFANWSITQPGQTSEMVLTYRLPFKIKPEVKLGQSLLDKLSASFNEARAYDSYSLLAQKQPGSGADEITSEFFYPQGWQPTTLYPTGVQALDGKVEFDGQLAKDLFYFVGLEQPINN